MGVQDNAESTMAASKSQVEKAQHGLRNARLARIQNTVRGMLAVKRKSLEKEETAAREAETAAAEFADELAQAEAKAKPKLKAKTGAKAKEPGAKVKPKAKATAKLGTAKLVKVPLRKAVG